MKNIDELNIDEIAQQEFEKNRAHYEELAVSRAMSRFYGHLPPNQLMIITAYEHVRQEEIDKIKSRIKDRVIVEHLYPDDMKEKSLKKIRI